MPSTGSGSPPTAPCCVVETSRPFGAEGVADAARAGTASGRSRHEGRVTARVWPDCFFEETGPTRNVSLLRRALDADGRRFIVTVAPCRLSLRAPVVFVPNGRPSVTIACVRRIQNLVVWEAGHGIHQHYRVCRVCESFYDAGRRGC